jgi:hypothetical protein
MLISADDNAISTSEDLEMLLLQSDLNHIPLNLSLVNYLASVKKYKTSILLNMLSTVELATLKKDLNPDIIYTEFNENQKISEISESLSVLQRSFPLARIIASGSRMEKVWKDIPNNSVFDLTRGGKKSWNLFESNIININN